MKHHPHFFRSFVALVWLIAAIACGTFAGNPGEDDTPIDKSQIVIPQVASVSLEHLGNSSEAAIVTDHSAKLVASNGNKCQLSGKLGAFGVPLGAACFGVSFVRELLYGSKNITAKKLTCAHFDKHDQGILPTLLCNDELIRHEKIETLRFKDNNNDIGLSFKRFLADQPAVNSWTPLGNDSQRYPAQIRIWLGANKTAPLPFVSLNLRSRHSGHVTYALEQNSESSLGDANYHYVTDTSACAATPNRQNCHWFHFNIKTHESAVSGPTAVHLSILSDHETHPQFLAIEGSIRYSDAAAQATFPSDADAEFYNFNTIRTIYLRMIQLQSSLWGSFDLKDQNDTTIHSPLKKEPTIDIAEILRNGKDNEAFAGICQNIGSDRRVDCTTIVPQDYDHLWQGAEKMPAPQPNYSTPFDFGSEAPVNTKWQ